MSAPGVHPKETAPRAVAHDSVSTQKDVQQALKSRPPDLRAYLGVRQVVGWLGVLLPPVLIVAGWFQHGQHPFLENSISGYYYRPLRDVFVGVLFSWGLLFLIYRYERIDYYLGLFACLAAIATALFPTAPAGVKTTWVGWVHVIASSTLFCLLAAICLLIFTRTVPSSIDREPGLRGVRSMMARHPTLPPAKKQRNTVYLTCGLIMIAGMLSALVSAFANVPNYWFILSETVVVQAFGYAWLVKGGIWFSDLKYNSKHGNSVPSNAGN